MDKEQHELYENARKRIQQKKRLYYHFVLLVLGSLFLFVANVLLKFGEPNLWYIWAVTVWIFIFVLHFIKVFITDRFMNKDWEREQIERLLLKQVQKIKHLETKVTEDNPTK